MRLTLKPFSCNLSNLERRNTANTTASGTTPRGDTGERHVSASKQLVAPAELHILLRSARLLTLGTHCLDRSVNNGHFIQQVQLDDGRQGIRSIECLLLQPERVRNGTWLHAALFYNNIAWRRWTDVYSNATSFCNIWLFYVNLEPASCA